MLLCTNVGTQLRRNVGMYVRCYGGTLQDVRLKVFRLIQVTYAMHKFWRSWRPLKRPRAPVGLKNLVGTSGLCNFASDLSQWVALDAQF